MAADRGAFIDQSQSFNVFIAEPNFQRLTSMHFYAWKKGLKTGMYYLRTRPAVDAIKFTVDTQAIVAKKEDVAAPASVLASPAKSPAKKMPIQEEVPSTPEEDLPMVCRREEGCFVCGS